MIQKIGNVLFKGLASVKDAFKRFHENEKGDSQMVTVIILIVIVLAVAAIFKDQMISIVNSIFEQLNDFIN